MTSLKPRCMSQDKNGVVQGIAYCSDGYLIPCCWLDGLQSKQQLINLGMYDSNLKLENNDSVENVVKSPQWRNFIRILVEEPKLAPTKCHVKCKNE